MKVNRDSRSAGRLDQFRLRQLEKRTSSAATSSDLAAHEAAADPHPGYATDADLAAHVAAADPHPGYLTVAEGNAAYDALGAAAAIVVDSIADADTTHAPSRNAVFDALALKAPLASPTFTGNPTAPTPTAGDNDTSIATTAFVTGAISTASTADRARANHTGTQTMSTISDLPTLSSGTWTPTVAGTANVSSVGTIQVHHYMRVGNEVSFSGTFALTPTASATTTTATITLPITSAFATSLDDGAGVAVVGTTVGFLRADSASGKLLLQFTSTGTTLVAVRISGHYRII